MAKEAGLLPDNSHPAPETRAMRQRSNAVQRFAALVAAKEREACAQVCDAERQDFGGVAAGPMTTDAGKRVHEAMAAGAATCAAAIRARGKKEGA